MDPLLRKVRNIRREGCVTITLNTHRTRPDNEKDPLALKNLVKEAGQRLTDGYDKKFAQRVLGNLNRIAERIDHSHNLESLIIFAHDDFADYTRLPIDAENRVILGDTFATRELVRALQMESAYYVLVLSRQKARLIEAYNDKVVKEFQNPFPVENTLYTTDKLKLSMNKGQDNLIEEFFNRVDKLVWETIIDHPLPILLATETRNMDHYLKVTDNKVPVIGHINKNRDDEQAHHIVPDAWTEVLNYYNQRNKERVNELHKAVGDNKVIEDLNGIWKAISEGRGKTLFVKEGYYQPVKRNGNKLIPVNDSQSSNSEWVDDIVSEFIEHNQAHGGDTVFLNGNELEVFNDMALVSRY